MVVEVRRLAVVAVDAVLEAVIRARRNRNADKVPKPTLRHVIVA